MLDSLMRSSSNLDTEVFVVDNASTDGSQSFVPHEFPSVEYIYNEENLGFGKANNQAIAKATGTYTLLVNPDTLLSEDTLETLYQYMEEHPKCGACGCKILNPDGSFAPESRRSIPTIGSSLAKVLGLSSLFPESKFFGRYYMGWLDEDAFASIPVLSGSFMFFRTELLKALGGFDERFFMYGEDIDLCYRVQQTEYRIDYVPATSIIHYKGQSARQNSKRYVKSFNEALYLFFDKHYTSNYSVLFRMVVYLGIYLKWGLSALAAGLKGISHYLADLVILNTGLTTAFFIRFGYPEEGMWEQYLPFLWIHGIASIAYSAIYPIVSQHKRGTHTISTRIKANFGLFVALVIISFFARELAFSRLILVYGWILSTALMSIYHLSAHFFQRSGEAGKGGFTSTRVLLVGVGEKTEETIRKLRRRVDWDYDIVGLVAQDRETKYHQPKVENIPVLGTVAELETIFEEQNADEIFFLLNAISYKSILSSLAGLQSYQPVSKLIPDNTDYLLGKANVDYLDDVPLIDIHLSYFDTSKKMLKRSFDLLASSVMLLWMWPAALLRTMRMGKPEGGQFAWWGKPTDHRIANGFLLAWYIFSGKLSLVGAPIYSSWKDRQYRYKPGITGFIQQKGGELTEEEEYERFDLYYLQQYSIWLDFELLLRMAVRGPKPLDYIEQTQASRKRTDPAKFSDQPA